MTARQSVAAELAALRVRLEMHMEAQEAERTAARAQRDALTSAVDGVERRIARIEHEMAEVKPLTDMVSEWRSRALGALTVLGVIGAAIWSLIMFAKDTILRWLGG